MSHSYLSLGQDWNRKQKDHATGWSKYRPRDKVAGKITTLYTGKGQTTHGLKTVLWSFGGGLF